MQGKDYSIFNAANSQDAAPMLQRKRTRYEEMDVSDAICEVNEDMSSVTEQNYLKSPFYSQPYNSKDDDNEIKNKVNNFLFERESHEKDIEEVVIEEVDLSIKQIELERKKQDIKIKKLNLRKKRLLLDIKEINMAIADKSMEIENEKTELKKLYIKDHGDEDIDPEYYEEVNKKEDKLIEEYKKVKELLKTKNNKFSDIDVLEEEIGYEESVLENIKGKLESERKNIWILYNDEKNKYIYN